MTKPIAGLAVMALVDAGALALTDTLGRHLPAYRGGDKADLTVEQLLTHTSGLPGQVPLYRDHPSRALLLDAIHRLPLTADARHPCPVLLTGLHPAGADRGGRRRPRPWRSWWTGWCARLSG